MRAFFEPKIPPHDPGLYAFERTDEGVAAEEGARPGRARALSR